MNEDFEDDAKEALLEWRAVRKSLSCACSHMDMPGTCPGRENCPMCETDEDINDE
jgi:hypothetical protein